MKAWTPDQAEDEILNGTEPESTWPDPLGDVALHGIAGDFVRTVAPHTEADPAALLFQFLASAGNVFGDRAWFTVERTRHYANLFVTLVGATSKARKGTSHRWVRDVVQISDPGWEANCTAAGLSTGEGLIARVRDPEYTKGKKGEDIILHAGAKDKRLLVVEEEFSRPLRVMERNNNTLAAVLRQAWDHSRLSILTREDPIKASGATISIITHITLVELRAELTEINTANGFGNRFLFALARRSNILPFGGNVGEGAIDELGRRLSAAVRDCPAGQIRFDEAARHQWAETYAELTEDHPGLYGALTARSEAQVIRVALLYAMLDQQHAIGLAHLRAALEIVRYANASVRHIFENATGNSIADTILSALQANAEGLTRTAIYSDLFGRNTPAAKIAAALSELLCTGSARPSRHAETGGRPTELWIAV